MTYFKVSKAKKILKKHPSALILMHINPDMDCVGAAYALLLYLLSLGKKAVIAIEAPLSPRLTFLIPQEHLKQYFLTKNKILVQNFSLVVCVDTSKPVLLGEFESFLKPQKTLVIDHHATFDNFGTWNFNFPSASSTCEIILDMLFKNLTPLMAQVLYAGVVEDTGNFRYSVKSSLLFKIAKVLKRFSIDTEQIYFQLFENESLARKKLKALIVSSIKTYLEGEMVISYFKKSFLENLDIDDFESDGLVREGHSLKGCLFSVFIKERGDGISLNLRSRNDFDVSLLASSFGGGGHKKASGIKLKNYDLKKVEQEVLPKIIESYKKWRKNES